MIWEIIIGVLIGLSLVLLAVYIGWMLSVIINIVENEEFF
jgi:ABC-type arginine/histidine transport system permease subunit